MDGLNQLRKMFLYAGVERQEYKSLLPGIREENLALLKVFSLLGLSMFFLLFDVTMLSVGFFSINNTTYFLCGLVMLAIFLCATFFLPKHPAGVTPCVYLFEITLYFFGIYISMLHADNPAVSAVAFLLVSPLLFYDRPIRLSTMNAMVVALFCVLAVRFKDPSVAEIDIWNMVTFGMVSVAITVSITSVKMRALAQTRQIELMSQTDLLTGAKNRNHYENQLPGYLDRCAFNLICVYADVNGLHEMNNEQGHQAGDAMLRETAVAMQRCFGSDHTYRVGGDEFVAFVVDRKLEVLAREVNQMRKDLEKKGYCVSFGTAMYEKGTQTTPNVYEIVRAAEDAMFADKRAFYRRQSVRSSR